MADREVRTVAVKIGADDTEFQRVKERVVSDTANLPENILRKIQQNRRTAKIAEALLPSTAEIDKAVNDVTEAMYNATVAAQTKNARALAEQIGKDQATLRRSIAKYVPADEAAQGRYIANNLRETLAFSPDERYAAKQSDRNAREYNRGIVAENRRMQKEYDLARKQILSWPAEKERLEKQAESSRAAAASVRDSNMMYGMHGAMAFGGGALGGLIGASGLGRGPIGSTFTGAIGGMGLGGSIGMMGGPVGMLAGAGIGTVAGAGVGLITGIVETTMHVLQFGIEKAMSVIREGAEKIIQLGMEYERTLVKFEVLTKGKESGEALFGGIERISTKSPYNTKQLGSSAELLLGFGVETNNILPALSRLGTIAAGDENRFQRLALAFGEVTSRGQLMSQELRQFAKVGVGIEDFALTAGKSTFQLKADLEAGTVGADLMIRTINRLTSEGGRFYGLNERVTKTTEGQWNALVNTAEMAGRRIGLALLKASDAPGLIGKGKGMIENFMDNGGVDKLVTKIVDFGSKFYDAIVPTLKEGFELASAFYEVLFGKGTKEGIASFDGFAQGMKVFFRASVDFMLTGVEVIKSLLPPMMDLIGFVARNTGFTGVSKEREKAIRAVVTASHPSDDTSTIEAEIRRRMQAEPGSIDATIQRVNKAVRDSTSIDDLKKARDTVYANNDKTGSGGGLSAAQTGWKLKGMIWVPPPKGAAPGVDFANTPGGEDSPIVAKLVPSAEIQKLGTEIAHSIKEGLTPLDKFTIGLKRLDEAKNFSDPLQRMSDKDYKIGLYEAYQKLKGSVKLPEDRLPSSAERDSAEALKIINENSLEAKTPQQEMIAVLNEALVEQQNAAKEIKFLSDFIRDNKDVLIKQKVLGTF